MNHAMLDDTKEHAHLVSFGLITNQRSIKLINISISHNNLIATDITLLEDQQHLIKWK